jgi:hypothetical protein
MDYCFLFNTVGPYAVTVAHLLNKGKKLKELVTPFANVFLDDKMSEIGMCRWWIFKVK